jgi:hypothetical protein
MAVSAPASDAPINRRGGRGRGRGSSGPRASIRDEEGKIIQELVPMMGRPTNDGCVEPDLYPEIPSKRYPPRPYLAQSEAVSHEMQSQVRPPPTEAQKLMRQALRVQLDSYRNSVFFIQHEEDEEDGGFSFEWKKNGIAPGMKSAYYPKEITIFSRGSASGVNKKAAQSRPGGTAIGGIPKISMLKSVPRSAEQLPEPHKRLDEWERREERSSSGREVGEDEEDMEGELDENDYEGDDLDEAWDDHQFQNYDDDDGYEEEEDGNDANIF